LSAAGERDELASSRGLWRQGSKTKCAIGRSTYSKVQPGAVSAEEHNDEVAVR